MKKLTEVWIDTLEFQTKGGWKEDTQFVHLMGSGYLIAAGKPGIPVDDAICKFDAPESGKYRIWVRSRNWMRIASPGKFNILLNGEGNGKVLGASPSDRWLWENAGDYKLKKGVNTINLHDLTGYFARCSSILLTTDMDYVPSPEIEKIHSERARIKGLDLKVKFGGEYDVIVAGGGPAGVPAAIMASRLGSKVLLIQDRPMLGGNGSSEIGITFDGAGAGYMYARETGIAEEIRRLRDNDPEYHGDWTRAMEKLVFAEKNLTVIYNNRVNSVEMDGNTIKGVTAMNIRTLEKTNYTGKIFVDCTGDGWLGYYAGAKYRFGREAKEEYGESFAPQIADTLTMSGCIKSGNIPFFHDAGEPVEYHAPSWVPELPKTDEEFGRTISGNGGSLLWWLEAPNDYDDVWDGEETRDALLLVVLGYYDHIKNYWSEKEKAKNLQLDFVSVTNGRRESRRFIGDYILTQGDCTSKTKFEDAISYSGWALDVHHPKGIYSGKEGSMYCVKGIPMITIPYRCLYSKNIDNLLFAGRNISSTHIAIGTLRVQNTIATMGQAVGVAAALCLKYNENPRGIYNNYIRELQQTLIQNDQFIPGIKNEDENDPCLNATVSASSFSKTEVFNTLKGIDRDLEPLDKPRGCTKNLSRDKKVLKELWLKLHSSLDTPKVVRLHVRDEGWSAFETILCGEEITAEATVMPGKEDWVKFSLNMPIFQHEFFDKLVLNVWLEEAEGISWRSVDMLSFNYRKTFRDSEGKWHSEGSKAFRVEPEKPKDELANCAPSNVINGWSRIIDKDNYEWVSDPEQTLPQWIELEFKKPTKVNLISAVFNTDLSNPATCWTVKRPGVPQCVKDYEIEVFVDSKWIKVATVTDNFMRKRIHRFDAMMVEKIRINVTETWGDKSARIQEIRACFES